MKFTAVILLLYASTSNSQDDGCENSRCYCSSSDIYRGHCDVTQTITQTSMNTTDECDSYCTDECGEGAGSSFACYPAGESLELSCDGGDTTCDCNCDHNVTVPNAMPFSAQCDAFCSRDDVCGASGSEFKCGTSSGVSFSSYGIGGIGMVLSAAVGIASLAFF